MKAFYNMTVACYMICMLFYIGCNNNDNSQVKRWNFQKSWQANADWKAEDYFTDPKTIALCKAIEKKDISAVRKLIAEGVNVKDIGKGNMTPLLWSFSSGEEFFKILLEHGADPNVVCTEDFGLPMVFTPGVSVMYMASRTQFPNYCKLCLEHGGDPNIVHTGFWHNSPIHAAILANRIDNVKLLIEHGADVNYCDLKNGTIPLVLSGPRFDCKLILLEAGASFSQRGGDILKDGSINYGANTIISELAEKYDKAYQDKSIVGQDYRKILNWFYTKGIDVKKAIPYVKKSYEYHQFTDRMNDEELDRWQREAYAVDTKQRAVLPSGPLYQVRTEFPHEPVQQKMYLIGITEKDVRIMAADGTFRTLNQNLFDTEDSYYFNVLYKNLVERYTQTVQINYFKQNSNPFEWKEEKLKDITVHEPLYFFYDEHAFVSCLFATSAEDKTKFHFPTNPNEQPNNNVVDLLDEREINAFLPRNENSENQEEKNKEPPRRKKPPILKTPPEGMFYYAEFPDSLIRYGDRKVEKQIISDGTPVVWSVTVDNNPEPNVSKKDFPPVALLSEPDKYLRKHECLLFVDEFKNNVIYSNFSHYAPAMRYTTLIELHNFDSGKHQVFRIPFVTSVEDLIPEKNMLLGRLSTPGKPNSYSNIVTLLGKNAEGQFDTYLQFAPYYQKISPNPKNFNETDNDIVAVRAVNSRYIITFAKKRLTLWDIDGVQSVYSIECHSSTSALSSNRKWLAVPFGKDGRYTTGIEIRDVLTGQCSGVLPGCFSVIQKMSFSPSGKQLAALYDNTLTIYSLETGQKSIEVPYHVTFRPAVLCWLGETMILVNDVLYDLQRQVPLCQLQSLDIKRLPVNQVHGGRLWTVIRDEGHSRDKVKYTLVNMKLPQQNMEETFSKTDPQKMYDYYPEVPLKIIVAIEGSEDNVLNNITKEYRQRLEKKGIKFSDDAKIQLRLTFRTATHKERSAFFGSVDPKTKDDYIVPEVKICDENVSFWSSPAIVYHKSNWKDAIKKAEQSNESGSQEDEFIQNAFHQPIPRYLMKPQPDFPWTVMKTTFDK